MSFWTRIAETEKKLDEVSYYQLLGVSPDASAEDIDAHYYELAGRLHPDRYVGRSTAEGLSSLNRICARLAQAKKVLQTPELRASYDLGLAKGQNKLEESSDKPRKLSQQDPATPMARGLYDKAMAELARGAKGPAKAKLTLAKQYEPDSQAIAAALAELEPATTVPERVVAEPPTQQAPEVSRPAEGEVPPTIAAAVAADAAAQQTKAPIVAEASRARVGSNAESQRSHDRQAVVLPVRLRIPTWERFEVLYTRDISGGGMFLRCAKPLPLGSQILLQLLTPNGETVEINAEVVHARAAGEGRASGMGLRFAEMTEPVKSQLSRLLSRTAVPKEVSLETMVSELVRMRDLPPFEVLGISESASADEKRLAYEALVRHFHPHHNGAGKDPALFEICRELIACVRRAYESVSRAH